MRDRPSVSVIVPFAGPEAALQQLLDRLRELRLRDGDEVIVADNRAITGTAPSNGPVRVLAAAGIGTPAYARNRAAEAAGGEWLVFIDADTTPAPSLLDDYFDPAADSRTAVLAGAITDLASDSGMVARWTVERSQMSDSVTLDRPRWRYAQTANCAVRSDAFKAVGGFDEAARAAEDADLCFRLQRSGWMIERRPHAHVVHASRHRVRSMVKQLALHGSGAAWLERRHPGSMPALGGRALAARVRTAARETVKATARGELDSAGVAAMDLLAAVAFEAGRLLPNRRRRARRFAGSLRGKRIKP